MALITLRDVSLHFGDQPLLDRVSLTIASGERVCLLGRNGAGKTTLMNVIGGDKLPDDGEVTRSQGVVVGALPQEVPDDLSGTVFNAVCRSLGPAGQRLAEFRRLSDQSDLDGGSGTETMKALTTLQQTIDGEDGWRNRQRVERILSRMDLGTDDCVDTFSAGMKRRVLLAMALVKDPDILLLDEPTNHLDLTAIEWLEDFLLSWNGTLILITHDRTMIRRLATRILEIDRGQLYSWQCDYATYLVRSKKRLETEEKGNLIFDKKLSAEEQWIRKGIKARRTRNEGRVRALEKMREIRKNRRDRTGQVKMELDEADRSGKKVVEAENLTFGYDDRIIVKDFSCRILRGDRIGIIGPNGAGKSTLIRLLLGDLSPQKGQIKQGTNLKAIYFDQMRDQLDEAKTVQENIAVNGDMVDIGGRRRHVIGYLKDFLFSPQRSRTPVWVLSGGEKNRLLIAKLFTRPANVLVLDEPTNDLDVETLELLEERLLDFHGTVILVSHDRSFINHVVTSTLVFEGPGQVEGYAGGYDDWTAQRKVDPPLTTKQATTKRSSKKAPPAKTPKRLGYMEKRELTALPEKIESLETRQGELFAIMSDPDFYRQDKDRIATVKAELAQVEQDLEDAFERWEILDSRDQS